MSIRNDKARFPLREGNGYNFDANLSGWEKDVHEQVLGKTNTIASSTPRPSAVFSTTSSSESLSNVDSDGQCEDHIHFDTDHQDDGDGRDCDDESDEYYENKTSALSASRATSTVLVARTMFASPMNAGKKSYSFWKTRIIEFFLVQIIMLASISLYVQGTNRLYLSSAVVVTGSEGGTAMLPPLNTANTTFLQDQKLDTENCIYAPGGGFSGFWYSLGRLQSLENPYTETFLCYSAGCLGVVATLLHHGELAKNNKTASSTDFDNMDNNNKNHYLEVYQMARSIQIDMQSGEMHRYRVVESFVDGLLEKLEGYPDDDETKTLFLDTIRRNLNVVTTIFDDQDSYEDEQSIRNGIGIGSQQILPLPPLSILPRAVVRRPSDIPSLKRLLIQSAWIPLVTGSSWTNRGHMDGGLSRMQHPRCSKTVGMFNQNIATPNSNEDGYDNKTRPKDPSTWQESLRQQVKLLANALNIEIKQEDVDELWRTGMEVGV